MMCRAIFAESANGNLKQCIPFLPVTVRRDLDFGRELRQRPPARHFAQYSRLFEECLQ
jgi:hypothetical protein